MTQGTDDSILVRIQIVFWIQEFFKRLFTITLISKIRGVGSFSGGIHSSFPMHPSVIA